MQVEKGLSLGYFQDMFLNVIFSCTLCYKFPKGWGQVSNKYIQHIYSYSTLSNYYKAQHSRGNKFANTIGMHQRSLCNHSGNDAISGGLCR